MCSSGRWDSGSTKESMLKKEIRVLAASVKEFKKALAAKQGPALPASSDSGDKKHSGPTDPDWKFNNRRNYCWLK